MDAFPNSPQRSKDATSPCTDVYVTCLYLLFNTFKKPRGYLLQTFSDSDFVFGQLEPCSGMRVTSILLKSGRSAWKGEYTRSFVLCSGLEVDWVNRTVFCFVSEPPRGFDQPYANIYTGAVMYHSAKLCWVSLLIGFVGVVCVEVPSESSLWFIMARSFFRC